MLTPTVTYLGSAHPLDQTAIHEKLLVSRRTPWAEVCGFPRFTWVVSRRTLRPSSKSLAAGGLSQTSRHRGQTAPRSGRFLRRLV